MSNLLQLQQEYPIKRSQYLRDRIYWLTEADKDPSIRKYIIKRCEVDIKWFCNVWIVGYNPRETPSLLPFILFPRQEELLDFLVNCYETKQWGAIAKCRYTGASYITCMYLLHSLMFKYDFVGSLASNKADSVDKSNSSKSLFYKIMDMYKRLPTWMQPFDIDKTKTRMQIYNPLRNSSILGESGKNIGRGGRSSMAMIDEAAFIESDTAMIAALSENTDCAVFVSTPNGMTNQFYRLVHNANLPVFYYHWYSDPRRSQAWRDEQDVKLGAAIASQELDIAFDTTENSAFIKYKWVTSAINSVEKLPRIRDITDTQAGLDVALGGVGSDNTILTTRLGGCIEPQVNIDLRDTTTIANRVNELITFESLFNIKKLCYDADGLGSGVTATLREISNPAYNIIEFHGAGKVSDYFWTDRSMPSGDFLFNKRAEAWYHMRERFRKTYLTLNGIREYPENELISIPDDEKLVADLIAPGYKYRGTKILIESKQEMKKRGVSSPDRADSLAYACYLDNTFNPWIT